MISEKTWETIIMHPDEPFFGKNVIGVMKTSDNKTERHAKNTILSLPKKKITNIFL